MVTKDRKEEFRTKILTTQDPKIDYVRFSITWLKGNSSPYISYDIPDTDFLSVIELKEYIKTTFGDVKGLKFIEDADWDKIIVDLQQIFDKIEEEYLEEYPNYTDYDYDEFIEYAKEEDLDWYSRSDNTELEKIFALSTHLQLSLSELQDIKVDDTYGVTYYRYGNEEYWVLEDYEADKLEEERVESAIEDCYLYDIKKQFPMIVHYIDMDKWIQDWCGNRGENLNSYDGTEYDYKVNNTYYYIYRQN